MSLYRHGDVMVQRVEALPEQAQARKSVVLAYGEVTGHSHRIATPKDAKTYDADGDLYLEITAEIADLIHEEHATIQLARGLYKVWQQREYSPKEIRRVYD